MNQNHHDEQMEAMRLEFFQLWDEKILSRLDSMHVAPNWHPAIQDIAWLAFRTGKGNP